MLRREAAGIARIAKESGLTRQTVYRIKDDPAALRPPWLRGSSAEHLNPSEGKRSDPVGRHADSHQQQDHHD